MFQSPLLSALHRLFCLIFTNILTEAAIINEA